MDINGRKFLNLQEAVAWLLQNNALPFQSTANYAPNTEIAKTTIINPSPAEIKVGALVLFADSKVGTVSGITSNGFMVGADYTDLANAIAYTTNIEVNGSGHLITTLSDGRTIDAGLVKQISGIAFNASRHLIASYNNGTTQDLGLVKGVSSFSIDGSQHLIVTYDNGTTQDLGAIFSGNVNISGNLTADSIIENMSATYAAELNPAALTDHTITNVYSGCVKNGNKLTFAIFVKVTRHTGATHNRISLVRFTVPLAVGNKLIPYSISGYTNMLNIKTGVAVAGITSIDSLTEFTIKSSSNTVDLMAIVSDLTPETEYLLRIEETFLLSDSLI